MELAKALDVRQGVTAIIGAGDALQAEMEGKYAIIDGQTGETVIEPDDAERERLLKKQAKEKALKELLDQLKGKPNETRDGRNVMVYCNIGSPADIDVVLQNDGGGIGLFRSEFLYLQGSDYPTEDEQFEAYKANPEGYFDSVELFALDTIIGGKGLNNFDLVMTLTGNSAEAIDWLATKNAHLTNVGSFGGASVKRIHRATTEDGKTTPVGAYLVKVLTADVEAEDKIDLRTNTAATEIVMEDGKAVGVKVKNENGEYTIRAKAVILASGGFGADLDRPFTPRPPRR